MSNTQISEAAKRAAEEMDAIVRSVSLQKHRSEIRAQRIQSAFDEATKELREQIHDLCHDKHIAGPVTPQDFCDGCEQFQIKLFGQSPIASLRSEVERLKKEHEDTKRILADPIAVHLNMLRGTIAIPSDLNLLHLLGEKYLGMEDENASLKSALKEAVEALEGWKLFYDYELEYASRSKVNADKEEDDYGSNYYNGKRAGFVCSDIWMTKAKQTLSTLKPLLEEKK